jgi:hypothetical protein
MALRYPRKCELGAPTTKQARSSGDGGLNLLMARIELDSDKVKSPESSVQSWIMLMLSGKTYPPPTQLCTRFEKERERDERDERDGGTTQLPNLPSFLPCRSLPTSFSERAGRKEQEMEMEMERRAVSSFFGAPLDIL